MDIQAKATESAKNFEGNLTKWIERPVYPTKLISVGVFYKSEFVGYKDLNPDTNKNVTCRFEESYLMILRIRIRYWGAFPV